MMFLSRRRNKKSNVNLSHVKPTTLAPGNLIPISFTRILAGDDLRFSPSAFVQAMPMNAPLVNGFKLCLEYFFIPDRLYNLDLLLDNTDVTQDPDLVKFPFISTPVTSDSANPLQVEMFLDSDASTVENIVAPGSLADYMGFPVGLYPTFPQGDNQFNMTTALGYLDVIYHYYVNQQISQIPTASYIPGASPGVPGEGNVRISVSDLKSLLTAVKSSRDPSSAIQNWINARLSKLPNPSILMHWPWLCSRTSIFQRCLPPYYLESWLATSGYDSSEVKIDLEADGNSISFRNISAHSHIQRWLDLALSGGSRYSDYINAQFDVSRLKNHSTPYYLGSDRQYLGSKVIYQTTGAGDADSPLGSFAGQASGGESFKTRSYHFGENGHFMVMASLVPDVIYQSGLNPFLRELNLGDVYTPALDNIAMQPLMVEDLYCNNTLQRIDTTVSDKPVFTVLPYSAVQKDRALGFVPAWSQLMQNVSRSHGRLTTDLRYWLLSRTYGNLAPDASALDAPLVAVRGFIADALQRGDINNEQAEAYLAFIENIIYSYSLDFTPYVLSHAYNGVFADISNQAQNFVLTCSFSMTCNREKGKVNVPTTL